MSKFQEIYECYQEEKAARIKSGFDMPGTRAIEDTAWIMDTSIAEVCKAISIAESKK